MSTTAKNVQGVTNSLRSILRGVNYPTTKERIIEVAEQNGADEFTLTILDDVGESSYFGLLDLVDKIQYVESEENKEYRLTPLYR